MVCMTQLSEMHIFPWVRKPSLTQFNDPTSGEEKVNTPLRAASGAWGGAYISPRNARHPWSQLPSLLPDSVVPLSKTQLLIWDLGVTSSTNGMELSWVLSEQGLACSIRSVRVRNGYQLKVSLPLRIWNTLFQKKCTLRVTGIQSSSSQIIRGSLIYIWPLELNGFHRRVLGTVPEVLVLVSDKQVFFYFWVSSWQLLLKSKVSHVLLSTHQSPHNL